jgi:hypothetical protein
MVRHPHKSRHGCPSTLDTLLRVRAPQDPPTLHHSMDPNPGPSAFVFLCLCLLLSRVTFEKSHGFARCPRCSVSASDRGPPITERLGWGVCGVTVLLTMPASLFFANQLGPSPTNTQPPWGCRNRTGSAPGETVGAAAEVDERGTCSPPSPLDGCISTAPGPWTQQSSSHHTNFFDTGCPLQCPVICPLTIPSMNRGVSICAVKQIQQKRSMVTAKCITRATTSVEESARVDAREKSNTPHFDRCTPCNKLSKLVCCQDETGQAIPSDGRGKL